MRAVAAPARTLGRKIDTLLRAQPMVMLALGVAALGMELFCLIDALRYPAGAYAAEGQLTRPWWLVILAVATLIGFVSVQNPLGVGIFGIVAAGVYLADVRPALQSVTPRRRKKGASGSGPYGSW